MKFIFAAIVWGIINSAYVCPGRMVSKLATAHLWSN
jgi:hypothetical protein